MTGVLVSRAYIGTMALSARKPSDSLMEYVATELGGECTCPIVSEAEKTNNGKIERMTSYIPIQFAFPHGAR